MTTMAKEVHSITNDPRMRETQASIASVSDQDFYITRTYGVFHIPARPTTEDYAIVVVTPRGDAIDLGDNRRFPFVISARQIAEDIIQDLQQHGIFVCAAERPTETDPATPREVGNAWSGRLVTEPAERWRGATLTAKFPTCT